MTIDETWVAARDVNNPNRDVAIFDLYLAATTAQQKLADYLESDTRRNVAALKAVHDLGRVIADSGSRKSVPLDVVRDIWRAACHG